MTSENFEFVVNHRHFVASVVSVLEQINDKSVQISESGLTKHHERLQNACGKILNNYRNDTESFEEGKIIKKVYKTMRDNITYLMEKNGALFTVKDPENRIITIIPGIDIGLIYKHFDDDDKVKFWQYIHLMFISSAKMIHNVNDKNKLSDKNKIIIDNIEILERDLTKTGLTVKGMLFNPFIGLGSVDSSKYGFNELYSGDVPQKSMTGGLPSLDINMFYLNLVSKRW